MWKVERARVVRHRQVVAPYTVGVYKWRWAAVCVAWLLASDYWECHVSPAKG